MPTRKLQVGEYYFHRGFCNGVIVKITSIGQGENPRCYGKILDLSTDGGLLSSLTHTRKANLDLSREVPKSVLTQNTDRAITSFQEQIDDFLSENE